MYNLYENTHRFFEIEIADTCVLLENVYKIRYKELCIEKRMPGFEYAVCQSEQEKDEYDDHSIHVLLRYRPTGAYVGTARLIMIDPSQPKKLFPIERYAEIDQSNSYLNINELDRKQTAEISRFIVSSQFDRRKGERRELNERGSNDGGNVFENRRSNDRRSTPHLSLLLMAGIVRVSIRYKIKKWLSVMDPALNRLLGYYGLNFFPVGPLVYYHGMRRPYCVKVDDVLERMYREYYEAWEVVTERGAYSFLKHNLRA